MADTARVGQGAPPRLELIGLTVEFGATTALADVDIAIAPGEIVGLLGHNGAGKTTLFNVVSGVIPASSGSVLLDGAVLGPVITPAGAAARGITVIHQEPALVPNLTVFDNLFLARPGGTRRELRIRAQEALDRVGSSADLDLPVAALSLGQRQLVDLARGMLGSDMRLLLLDEPTAALGKRETVALHGLIRRLAAEGVAVVYVSHRLPDILDICTRAIVLRGGRLAVDRPTSEFTPATIAEALVPDLREVNLAYSKPGAERIAVPSYGVSARAGEVVGVFGMAGGEQFDLAARLGGADTPILCVLDGTEVEIDSPRTALRRRVHSVPPDRDTDGLLGGQSAIDNVLLPWFGHGVGSSWWVTPRTGGEIYDRARRELNILGPDARAEISQYSGGNRQKHLLARWMYPSPPDVLVMAQPTQGVDVGARLDIVDAVRAAAAAGAAVLVCSAESDEIASMCDRSYVVVGERTTSVPRTPEFNEDLLSALLALAAPTEPTPKAANE
ncbi:sugar ABC transporter ATP-binding protein [Subtercola boreus]|uniref:Sugar ABC transporter ATP-binding protein n=1 Tax=Subtercola boreus TaxID=120213 RepID=A0A3E0VBU4_9MICO|nr:sugar ABC transporter ATP-binding protein [Subtercola boreus]